MIDRRTFLRNISLLTLGGIASQKVMASNPTRSIPATNAVSSATAGKKMGLQTYSLGQELLQDMPNGLNRLAKAGYTDLEIFGYREDTGKFGDYNPKTRHSSPPRIIRKWWMTQACGSAAHTLPLPFVSIRKRICLNSTSSGKGNRYPCRARC